MKAMKEEEEWRSGGVDERMVVKSRNGGISVNEMVVVSKCIINMYSFPL